MEYRLSLTSRLVFLGGLGLLLLMALLFLLGVQAGRGLPQEEPGGASAASPALPAFAASHAARVASMATRTASQAAGKALKSVQADLVKGKP